jgi:hypothetical protein
MSRRNSTSTITTDSILQNHPSLARRESTSTDRHIPIIPEQTIAQSSGLFVENNSLWNDKIVFVLKKLGRKTMGYRWMHEKEAVYYDEMNTRYNIYETFLLALLGTITGAGLINFVIGAGIDNSKIVYIVLTIVQLVGITISVFIKEYRSISQYERSKNDHSYAAIKHGELNLNIQYQLALKLVDREPGNIFLRNSIKSFSDILYLSPPIRECTKKKCLEEYWDSDMFNPIIEENDDLQLVVVDDRNNPRSIVTQDPSMDYQITRWLQHF